jgi:hypothetical protein
MLVEEEVEVVLMLLQILVAQEDLVVVELAELLKTQPQVLPLNQEQQVQQILVEEEVEPVIA